MISEGTIAKTLPVVTLPWVGLLPFDWVFIPITILAILMGWMARMAKLYHQRSPWDVMWRDMVVNFLIGGAIAAIGAGLIHYFNLNYIEALLVVLALTFGGLETIDMAWSAAKRLWQWLIDKMFESESARRAGKTDGGDR